MLDDAQGEGLGRAVWLEMREQNPRVFWRSRHANVVNDFYFAESDGSYRLNGWKMFWYGISDFDEIQRCVEHAHRRPATLVDVHAVAGGRVTQTYRHRRRARTHGRGTDSR